MDATLIIVRGMYEQSGFARSIANWLSQSVFNDFQIVQQNCQ